MHIDHIAIWTTDLERLKTFYETYFDARAGDRYTNPRTGFESYFLTFATGARLELMRRPDIPASRDSVAAQHLGLIHFAIALGSEAAVDRLTARLRVDGYPILDGPRRTGDGYYEATLLDPDQNRLELTA